jgi:hypothetical protein
VQGAPALVQHRGVDAVAYQRMTGHELGAIGADEEVVGEKPAVVPRVVDGQRSASRL